MELTSLVSKAAPLTEKEVRKFIYEEPFKHEPQYGWLMIHSMVNSGWAILLAIAGLLIFSAGSYLWFESTSYGLGLSVLLIACAATLAQLSYYKGSGGAFWHKPVPVKLKFVNGIPFGEILQEYPHAYCEKQELKCEIPRGKAVLAEVLWLMIPHENGSVTRHGISVRTLQNGGLFLLLNVAAVFNRCNSDARLVLFPLFWRNAVSNEDGFKFLSLDGFFFH
jgi:hypothetical protein